MSKKKSVQNDQNFYQVAGSQEVANIESIDLAITLEIIDLKGKLDPCWMKKKIEADNFYLL